MEAVLGAELQSQEVKGIFFNLAVAISVWPLPSICAREEFEMFPWKTDPSHQYTTAAKDLADPARAL